MGECNSQNNHQGHEICAELGENAVPVAGRRVCPSRALVVHSSVAVPQPEFPDACGQMTKKLSLIKSFQRE